MIKTLNNNESFITKQKHKKLSNNLILERTFTPVKLIPKDKIIGNKGYNYYTNLIEEKKTNNFYSKIKKNNIKLKLLNPKNKNSRNFSSLNGFSTTGIFTNSNNKKFTLNNSLSMTTNLKTTMDTNEMKTRNLKDQINNKENSGFLKNESLSFFSSFSNYYKKSLNRPIKNISLIKKRPKIKIPKSNSNIFLKIKNNNKKSKISKHLSYNQKTNKNNYSININNNNSFIFPKRINTLKQLYNNVITPIRKNTKIKHHNSLSLNKKINAIDKNISTINKKQKIIDKNRISIQRTKLKNIYMLLEKQKETICNKSIIKKEKEDIENIMKKLKKVKEKTYLINNESKGLNHDLIKNKTELNHIKENINNAINDKKNVNTMIISLHRRIIDIKKRIKEHDEKNIYLDKTFYELSLKYKDVNI